MTSGAKSELPDLLEEVNARISEYAASADAGGLSWEFVCECGSPECREHVRVTVAEYEALRQTGGAILAPGHEPATYARARARARELVGEAKALTAQATHQLKRAARGRYEAAELIDDLARQPKGEFACGRCGYGIAVSSLPDRCPMCGSSDWQAPPLR